MRADAAAEAESVSVFARGGDAEGDVLFEGHAEFFGVFAEPVTPCLQSSEIKSMLLARLALFRV